MSNEQQDAAEAVCHTWLKHDSNCDQKDKRPHYATQKVTERER